MKTIDSWAIKTLGIPGAVLMENAGRSCVDILEEYFDLEHARVLVVCGKGNNGGDGFVMARHLQNRKAVVKVVLLGNHRELKGESLLNYKLAKKSSIDIQESVEPYSIKKTISAFNPEIIVDAIFGTGFTGAPHGIYKKVIELINNRDSFVFSVDIPSGINGDTGQFSDTCVIADATATMCLPKRGNFLFPGRDCCGDLYVVDIGVPYGHLERGAHLLEFDDIYKLIPPRPPDGNKGTFGNVLIIAGARGFSGAAAMAALSALKVGAGLVRLAAPRGIMDALESKLLEVVKVPLAQTRDETISTQALATVLPHLKKTDVVVIGPGMTTNPETAMFLLKLLPHISVPVVVDADAINIIAHNTTVLKKIHAPFILTPHPGELARLIAMQPEEINLKRIALAETWAKKLGGVLIVKGAPTVIASPDGEVYVNPTGNSGLASAGSGDVLVGMISGFLAQNLTLSQASCVAVFLHGLCAELAMEQTNEYSLIASDVIEYIPEALNYILRREFVDDERDA